MSRVSQLAVAVVLLLCLCLASAWCADDEAGPSATAGSGAAVVRPTAKPQPPKTPSPWSLSVTGQYFIPTWEDSTYDSERKSGLGIGLQGARQMTRTMDLAIGVYYNGYSNHYEEGSEASQEMKDVIGGYVGARLHPPKDRKIYFLPTVGGEFGGDGDIDVGIGIGTEMGRFTGEIGGQIGLFGNASWGVRIKLGMVVL